MKKQTLLMSALALISMTALGAQGVLAHGEKSQAAFTGAIENAREGSLPALFDQKLIESQLDSLDATATPQDFSSFARENARELMGPSDGGSAYPDDLIAEDGLTAEPVAPTDPAEYRVPGRGMTKDGVDNAIDHAAYRASDMGVENNNLSDQASPVAEKVLGVEGTGGGGDGTGTD